MKETLDSSSIVPGTVYHYTVFENNVAWGGLHDYEYQAEQAKVDLIKDETTVEYGKGIDPYEVPAEKLKKIARWQKAPITNLTIGQDYHEFGKGPFKHGVDDGTHGSKRKKGW